MNNVVEPPVLLVVDDVPANIQILHSLLKEEYEIYFATNGPDALDLAHNRAPDLVLLDVMMPVMDGYEVCRQLKADPNTEEIPIIFVTAMGEVDDETRGLELGAIDYITKPISPAIVRARVRNHIRLKQQGDLLRQLSFIDGLTGIANRRRFDELLQAEWRRAQRSSLPLSLLILDVDHFKAFNDHYGHLGGDEALRQLAMVLRQELSRPADLACRYGGEEFAALLPETDPSGAQLLAERLRRRVEQLAVPLEHEVAHFTVSVGVASATPCVGQSAIDLLELADECLYQAKHAGRNRVVAQPLEFRQPLKVE